MHCGDGTDTAKTEPDHTSNCGSYKGRLTAGPYHAGQENFPTKECLYMWDSGAIGISLEDADDDVAIVRIDTPAGTIKIAGAVFWNDSVLYVKEAHIEGLYPGALGRAGLNAIGRKLLEEANVEKIVIAGSVRTTGRNPGRRPKVFRFPHD
jgi:hypothetical protein